MDDLGPRLLDLLGERGGRRWPTRSGPNVRPPASLRRAIIAAMLRIYADAEGESHFEDVGFKFEQAEFVPPAPPVMMTAFEDATSYAFELVPPGWHGDWHPAPQRLMAIYLSGEGLIQASDGEVRKLERGTVLLAEDTAGKGHVSEVTGSEDMLVLIVMLTDRDG